MITYLILVQRQILEVVINMVDKILDSVIAEVFTTALSQPGPQMSLNTIENELQTRLPKTLVSILTKMGGGIYFSAKYKPDVRSPLSDSEGYNSLDFLYGLTDDDNGVLAKNRTYGREQIPDTYITVGESSGGDQLCIEKNSGKVYYWHHEALSEDKMFYLVASSFDDFLSRLEKVNHEFDENILDKVEISNLDF